MTGLLLVKPPAALGFTDIPQFQLRYRSTIQMPLPNSPSLMFLAYLFVFMPWVALRSQQRLRSTRRSLEAGLPPTEPYPTRHEIWQATFLSLSVMLFIAIWAASSFEYRWYALPQNGTLTLLASLLALFLLLGLYRIVRRSRTMDERRQLFVFDMVAQTPREWWIKIGLAIMAGLGEELAYRGVGMQILWYMTDNPWLSALLLSAAFAMAHVVQGPKSTLFIGLIALLMHGLVYATGSLWGAIAVHILYDLVAMRWIAQDKQRFLL